MEIIIVKITPYLNTSIINFVVTRCLELVSILIINGSFPIVKTTNIAVTIPKSNNDDIILCLTVANFINILL